MKSIKWDFMFIGVVIYSTSLWGYYDMLNRMVGIDRQIMMFIGMVMIYLFLKIINPFVVISK